MGNRCTVGQVCSDETFSGHGYDFGDAPAENYPTQGFPQAAAHRIQAGAYLGEHVDADQDGASAGVADGDDTMPSSLVDDEDGVVFLTQFRPSETATVVVTAAGPGHLNAWIDFNRDGTWASDEQVFRAEALVAGENRLTLSVPSEAVVSYEEPTFSRWRFSTSHAELAPHGGVLLDGQWSVPNGEVEDHPVFVQNEQPAPAFDFGSASPDIYATYLRNDGARHRVQAGFSLGASVEADADGGAANDVASPDQDGVHFPAALTPGTASSVRVDAPMAGRLDAWIDYDRNGRWGVDEQIATSLALDVGANSIAVRVPAWAAAGAEATYARFRLSREGGLSPTGPSDAGEVEDVAVMIGEPFALQEEAPVLEIQTSTADRLAGRVVFPTPRMSRVVIDGAELIQMNSPGSESLLGPIEQAGVPVFRRLIAVPRGAQVSVSLQQPPTIVETVPVDLMPYQIAFADNDFAAPLLDRSNAPLESPLQPLAAIAAADGESLIRITPVGRLRDLDVALLEIPTGSYDQGTQMLQVFREVAWDVRFEGGSGFLPHHADNPFENSQGLYNSVVNADVVHDYLFPDAARSGIGEEFLILTHPTFRQAADRLAQWKTEKAISTRVIDVGKGTPYETANAVRQLIETAWSTNQIRPGYVLLLGDAEHIPSFYASTLYSGGLGGPNVVVPQDRDAAQWISLGTSHFEADGDEFVDLVRQRSELGTDEAGATVADAIRFVHQTSGEVVVVDNQSEGFETLFGTWLESQATDGYEESSFYSYDAYARARYTPDLPESGLYEVSARWSAATPTGVVDRDADALYVIAGKNTSTDQPYAYVAGESGDTMPDLALGRIPVDELEQALTIVERIISYERTPPIVDSADGYYQQVSIASTFQGFRAGAPIGRDARTFVDVAEASRETLISAGVDVERVYGEVPPTDASAVPSRHHDGSPFPDDLRAENGFAWSGSTADIVDAFNEGRFLMIQRGHGWPGGWAYPSFQTEDVAGLQNKDQLPIVYSINCADRHVR